MPIRQQRPVKHDYSWRDGFLRMVLILRTVNGFASGLWARRNRMSSPGWSTVRQNRHRLGAIDGTCLQKRRQGRAVGHVTCAEADRAFSWIKADQLAS
ncbi:unnamed protein product [Spirodela intermedia]|uniref:Uncharacterized protein n=1 Tax=Spirodela intermedia TaxID=51605 RepID=A0A7I8KAQ0_SPIIN|nr:unnamed protein product [Spirodela intermedia]